MSVLLAIALLAAPASYRLVDSVGEPVRGATVRVVGGVASAVTDDEGRFRLDPEPAPPFDLVVSGPHGAILGRARVDIAGSRRVSRRALAIRGRVSVPTASTPSRQHPAKQERAI